MRKSLLYNICFEFTRHRVCHYKRYVEYIMEKLLLTKNDSEQIRKQPRHCKPIHSPLHSEFKIQ